MICVVVKVKLCELAFHYQYGFGFLKSTTDSQISQLRKEEVSSHSCVEFD